MDKKRVLVIDDSKTFRSFISKTIEDGGYDTHTVSNGADALKIISKLDPDLITVDVEMPGMNGFEFCEKLRINSNIPTIMITSTDPLISRKKGFRVGAIDFISKPFNPDELQHAVDKVLKPESKYSSLNILVVDDSKMIRVMVRQIIGELGIEPILANDGQSALEHLRSNPGRIDLLLTDYEMPLMNGLELCKTARDESLLDEEAPILFLSTHHEEQNVLDAFNYGATDYVFKPFFREELLSRVRNHLSHRLLKLELDKKLDAMEKKFSKQSKDLFRTQEATINLMASLSECRDFETGWHIKRTQSYVHLLASEIIKHKEYREMYGLEWVENVTAGAPLHDIGKIGVLDKILLKPGPLTDEEFSEMKKHAIYGRDALRSAQESLGVHSYLEQAIEIAGGHHEKWDGSGYPDGLKGEAIPLPARIMAIADVYDALVSKRVYKDAMSHEKSCDIIIKGKGNHFDPFLVELFVKHAEKMNQIHLRYQD